jgi:hypothetical protein
LAGEASGEDWTIMSSAESGSHKARVCWRAARKRRASSAAGVETPDVLILRNHRMAKVFSGL